MFSADFLFSAEYTCIMIVLLKLTETVKKMRVDYYTEKGISMPKIRSITIGTEMKLSPNFNSAGAMMAITADVDEGEDVQEAKAELRELVEEAVFDDVQSQLRKLTEVIKITK